MSKQYPIDPALLDVTNNVELQFYSLNYQDKRIGFTEYVDDGDQRIFFHTEIDGAYTGQGLASVLIGAALTDTVEKGLRIVPVCPFVKRFTLKHPAEFASKVDKVTPAALAAVTNAD
jgi:predicted GNAT family acetyltransferase